MWQRVRSTKLARSCLITCFDRRHIWTPMGISTTLMREFMYAFAHSLRFAGVLISALQDAHARRNIMVLFEAMDTPDGAMPALPLAPFPSLKLEARIPALTDALSRSHALTLTRSHTRMHRAALVLTRALLQEFAMPNQRHLINIRDLHRYLMVQQSMNRSIRNQVRGLSGARAVRAGSHTGAGH